MKRISKFIASILIGVLIAVFMPNEMYVTLADDIEENKLSNETEQTETTDTSEQNTDENPDINYNKDDAYIINELADKRGPNTKQYAMSDDTVLVEQFAENVNYYDEDTKQYEQIDNSLIQKTDGSGNIYYENAANAYKVKFEKNTDSNTVDLSDGKYKIAFNLLKNGDEEKKGIQGKIEEGLKTANALKASLASYSGKKLKTPKATDITESQISYDGYFDNVDLNYKLTNNGVKENIIINEKSENYIFVFEISVENLTLVLNDDGSVSAKNDDGEIKYVIPAPFMTDNGGNYSEAVSYSVEKISDGNYTLTVTADSAWINAENTELPVTIDPIINPVTDTDFTYANVFQGSTPTPSSTEAYVGVNYTKNCGCSNAYLKYSIGSMAKNYTLLSGELKYTRRGKVRIIFTHLNYSLYTMKDPQCDISTIPYSNDRSNLNFIFKDDVSLWNSDEETHTESFDINGIVNDQVVFAFLPDVGMRSGNYMAL